MSGTTTTVYVFYKVVSMQIWIDIYGKKFRKKKKIIFFFFQKKSP